VKLCCPPYELLLLLLYDEEELLLDDGCKRDQGTGIILPLEDEPELP